MARKRFYLEHFFPLVIAMMLAVGVMFSPFKGCFISYDQASFTDKNSIRIDTSCKSIPTSFANLSDRFSNEEWVMDYWLPKDPLVVIGSSEMTHSQLPSISYNFFNAHGVPCIGIGHAGNQCLCILSQLALMDDYLDSMRLVIILSPGWFEAHDAGGTPLSTFLEFNDEHFFYYLENNSRIPANVRQRIDGYLSNHLKDINSPSAIIRSMAYRYLAEKKPIDAGAYFLHRKLLSSYVDWKRNTMNELFHSGKGVKPFDFTWKVQDASLPVKFQFQMNWDSLNTNAIAKFKRTATNNSMGIENSYYDQWMKGKPQKEFKVVNSNANQEFQDLCLLLDYLKNRKCKPLIVMQPLNPLCYANLSDFDPFIQEIGAQVEKNGFEFFNMNQTDPKKYEVGMLSDFQHMGEYGWYLLDKKMVSYFLEKK